MHHFAKIVHHFVCLAVDGMLCFQVKQNSSKFVPIDAEWTYARVLNSPEPLNYYELHGLEPETDYQLVMRVGNKLGWSDYSSSNFVFHTPDGILLLPAYSRLMYYHVC